MYWEQYSLHLGGPSSPVQLSQLQKSQSQKTPLPLPASILSSVAPAILLLTVAIASVTPSVLPTGGKGMRIIYLGFQMTAQELGMAQCSVTVGRKDDRIAADGDKQKTDGP